MISVHIMYPRTDDSTFDMAYYVATHMTLFADILGDACVSWGASAIAEGPWAAIGWTLVDSQDAFNTALAERGAEVAADVANYTNVSPEMIIGEVASTSLSSAG